MKCKYLHSSELKDLEREVNNFLESKWEMFGPLLSVANGSTIMYHQTIIKHSAKVEPTKQFNPKMGLK